VSLNQAENVAQTILGLPRPIGRWATTNALLEIYALIKIYNVGVIFQSSELGIMMDGTSNRAQRIPLAIRISGTRGCQRWALPVGLREPFENAGRHLARPNSRS